MHRLGMILLGVLVAVAVTAPSAMAQPATMLNGVENIVMSPLDVVLAPVVAGQTVQSNIEAARVDTGGKIAAWGLGIPWIWTLQNVLTGARIVSGFAEIGLGLALTPVSFFKDVPERQIFDATTASPMVNREGAFDVVFGSHYIATH